MHWGDTSYTIECGMEYAGDGLLTIDGVSDVEACLQSCSEEDSCIGAAFDSTTETCYERTSIVFRNGTVPPNLVFGYVSRYGNRAIYSAATITKVPTTTRQSYSSLATQSRSLVSRRSRTSLQSLTQAPTTLSSPRQGFGTSRSSTVTRLSSLTTSPPSMFPNPVGSGTSSTSPRGSSVSSGRSVQRSLSSTRTVQQNMPLASNELSSKTPTPTGVSPPFSSYGSTTVGMPGQSSTTTNLPGDEPSAGLSQLPQSLTTAGESDRVFSPSDLSTPSNRGSESTSMTLSSPVSDFASSTPTGLSGSLAESTETSSESSQSSAPTQSSVG